MGRRRGKSERRDLVPLVRAALPCKFEMARGNIPIPTIRKGGGETAVRKKKSLGEDDKEGRKGDQLHALLTTYRDRKRH